MKNTLNDKYEKLVQTGTFLPDENQRLLIAKLDQLSFQLGKSEKKSLFQSLTNSIPSKGFYIYGKVGVGKTSLMDLFFKQLSLTEKKRTHFHAFMKEIHENLKKRQGEKNPLNSIAKEFSKNVKLLCLDEFFVNDIADAMILAQLIETFLKHQITLIITSNSAPNDLYANGLARDQFLPAISLITKNLEIFALNTDKDYRYRPASSGNVFYSSPQEKLFEDLFTHLAENQASILTHTRIFLYDKAIEVKACADNIIWFDFRALCAIPRSQLDYLSIANKYKIIIIDNIDRIDDNDLNTAKYFINLIDILYDLKNVLILGSAVNIEQIYVKGKLVVEFQRTVSRLNEMQTADYLNNAMEGILCRLLSK